jgi:outer membrane protein TolC
MSPLFPAETDDRKESRVSQRQVRSRQFLVLAAALLAAAPASADRDTPGPPGAKPPRRAAAASAPATPKPKAATTPATVAPSGNVTAVEIPAPAPQHAERTSRDKLDARVMRGRVGVPAPKLDSNGAIALSLLDVLRTALAHSLDIEMSRLDWAVSGEGITTARGDFDPLLSGYFKHSKDVQPNGSNLAATVGQDFTDIYNVGIGQKLVYGASYNFTVNSTRRESNNPFVRLSPSYSADATLTYTQPLLRGLGRAANRRFVSQAENSRRVAELGLQAREQDTLRDAATAYFDLQFALRDLDVARSSHSLALELLRKNKIMVEVGTLAPLEISQAEASVADRELLIIQAENALGAAEDNLRRLLGVEEGSSWWDARIVPTEDLAFERFDVDPGQVLSLALATRPELQASDLLVENQRLAVAAAKDTLLPQLNVEVTASSAGLDGDHFADLDPLVDSDGNGNPFDDHDVRVDADVSDAFDQVRSREFNSWSAALIYSQPLRNRAAKGAYASRRIELEREKISREQLRQSIELEVRKALRDLGSADEGVTSARVARELSEKKLDAEIKKFENGLSTNFEVLQFQTDLQEAQSNELRAIRAYLASRVAVQRARGTILEDNALAPLR